MKHNELRQFLRCANAESLSPIEKDVFQYYYSKAENPGIWYCPDADTATDIFRSRNGVCDARKGLIQKGWIAENGLFNIQILKTFSVSNQTETPEIPVGNQTQNDNSSLKSDSSVSNQTETPEIPVGNQTPLKEKRNFKEDIKRNKEVEAEGARARATAARPKSSEILLPDEFDPLEAFGIIFPNYTPTPFQKQMIANHIRDGTIWRQALFFWAGNNHKAQSVEKLVDKYEKLVKEQEESVKNAVIQPNQPKFKSAAEKRDERAVGEYQYIEKLRADNEQRRLEKLRENNARGS